MSKIFDATSGAVDPASRWLPLVLAGLSLAATPAPDADTARWWKTTADLSGDALEGRDTGSPGHARAVAYVEARFAKAGLKPAGDGGFRQTVPLHEVALDKAGTRFAVVQDGRERPLRFLYDLTAAPATNLPASLDAPIVFRGRCAAADFIDVRGKAVVCYGARGTNLPPGRAQNAARAGAAALIQVDHGFVEPANWPVAYARSMGFRGAAEDAPPLPSIRLAASALGALIAGAGYNADSLLDAGAEGSKLPSFDAPGRFKATFRVIQRDLASDNVVGLLPGTDPKLADEPVLLIAHLDGYGYGEPVKGDRIYNGALDDAAYVATLIGFAERRGGKGLRRPVLIAAVTAEEKGLLGSRWLAGHPTAAAKRPVAVLNMDQLRPLYPLTILTTLALDDSTLGDDVRALAARMGFQVRPDREPERNLMRRTDHWPFVEKGVPGVSFLFGVDAGTDAERRYKDWYLNRYHRPADDVSTPIDFKAAGEFNRFYYELAERVADSPTRPAWKPGGAYAPKP